MSHRPSSTHQAGALITASTAVILDFDGVLADSEEFQFRVWRKLLEERRLPSDGLCSRAVVGCSDEDIVRRALPESPASLREELVAEKNRRCAARTLEVHPVPGAVEFVRRVAGSKRLFVCSTSNREHIEAYLARWFPFARFERIIGGQDVTQAKPSPEGYQRLVDAAGLDPRTTVVIEDSRPGIESALAAGLQVIHLNRFGDPLGHAPSIAGFEEAAEDVSLPERGVPAHARPASARVTSLFRVFLSHDSHPASAHELDQIMRIASKRGIHIETVNPGQTATNVATAVREKVAGCDGLLGVLHEGSDWCQAEIAMAYAFHLPVYLICHRPIQGIAQHLTSLRQTDLSNPTNLRRAVETGLDVLSQEMSSLRERLPEQPGLAGPVVRYRWELFMELIERAKNKLSKDPGDGGFRPTLILGVSRGGIIVADVLSRLLLDKPLALLSASRSEDSVVFEDDIVAPVFAHHAKSVAGGLARALIVDDVVKSGRSMAAAYAHVRRLSSRYWKTEPDTAVRALALVGRAPRPAVLDRVPLIEATTVSVETRVILPYGLG